MFPLAVSAVGILFCTCTHIDVVKKEEDVERVLKIQLSAVRLRPAQSCALLSALWLPSSCLPSSPSAVFRSLPWFCTVFRSLPQSRMCMDQLVRVACSPLLGSCNACLAEPPRASRYYYAVKRPGGRASYNLVYPFNPDIEIMKYASWE